jgi:hypothetical protein
LLSAAWYQATTYHDCDSALILCDYALDIIAWGLGGVLFSVNAVGAGFIGYILTRMTKTFCADTIGKACKN